MGKQDVPLSDMAKANAKATRRLNAKKTEETVTLAGPRGLKQEIPPFGMSSRVWSQWDTRRTGAASG